MKYTHSITIRVLQKEKEFNLEPEFISDMLKNDLVECICESDILKKEDIQSKIVQIEPEGNFSSIIYDVQVVLKKRTDKLIEYMFKKLTEKDQKFLKETALTRIDEECQFFLRFDKKTFMEKKDFVLVDHGNCIHVRIKIAAFPANKENAEKVMMEFLSKVI